MKKTRVFLVLFLLFFASAPFTCPLCEETKSLAVVKPGKGIGDINFNDTIADVVKKMGSKPSDGKTVMKGKETEYWLIYKEQGLTFVFNKKKRLTEIKIANPLMIVQDGGIKLNMSIKDVEKIYGEGMKDQKKEQNYFASTYEDKGIKFLFNAETEKMQNMILFKKPSE